MSRACRWQCIIVMAGLLVSGASTAAPLRVSLQAGHPRAAAALTPSASRAASEADTAADQPSQTDAHLPALLELHAFSQRAFSSWLPVATWLAAAMRAQPPESAAYAGPILGESRGASTIVVR